MLVSLMNMATIETSHSWRTCCRSGRYFLQTNWWVWCNKNLRAWHLRRSLMIANCGHGIGSAMIGCIDRTYRFATLMEIPSETFSLDCTKAEIDRNTKHRHTNLWLVCDGRVLRSIEISPICWNGTVGACIHRHLRWNEHKYMLQLKVSWSTEVQHAVLSGRRYTTLFCCSICNCSKCCLV